MWVFIYEEGYDGNNTIHNFGQECSRKPYHNERFLINKCMNPK